MANLEAISSVETPANQAMSQDDQLPGIYLFLKIVEYLLVAASIGTVILLFVLKEDRLGIYAAVFTSLFIFLFLTNGQLKQNYQKSAVESKLAQQSELYNYMYTPETEDLSSNASLQLSRKKALKYSMELIEDYKKTRDNSRNIYYVSQIATIILSGVTPILVLLERLDTGEAWLKWLPVLFPALASIVTSIVTSFPFQETWIAANKTVELLEAEQEKFILGITPAYRCYDITDPTQRQQMAKKAIENFISQVNNIHLKQLQQGGSEQLEAEKKEENKSAS
ncbi:MAG: DUF4231 domain-containing protein [Lyngbya sp.]|nr:DUF4231 domain-containing protein [Lyngbya sp.]